MISRLDILVAGLLAATTPATSSAQTQITQTVPIEQTQPPAEQPADPNYSKQLFDMLSDLHLQIGDIIRAKTMYGSLSITNERPREYSPEKNIVSHSYLLNLNNEDHNIGIRIPFDMQDMPMGLSISDYIIKKGGEMLKERGTPYYRLPREGTFAGGLFRFPEWTILDSYSDYNFDGYFDSSWNMIAPRRVPKNPGKGHGAPIIDYLPSRDVSELPPEQRQRLQDRFAWRVQLSVAAFRTYLATK